MGYELYRLLATVTPSMSSRRGMPPSKKKKVTTSDKANGEPEVIDLDKEEKHMELLIGRSSDPFVQVSNFLSCTSAPLMIGNFTL